MKTYIVEEYNPKVKFDAGSNIIALTPLVCYQLDKAGYYEYSIPTDFYSEAELQAYEPEHEQELFKRTHSLDEFIKENITEAKAAGLDLATMYYPTLRTSVFGAVYLQSYIMRKVLEAVTPSAVVYVSHALPKIVPFDFTLRDIGTTESYCSQVTELLCTEQGIPFSRILLEGKILQPHIPRHQGLLPRLKGFLSKSERVRKFLKDTG